MSNVDLLRQLVKFMDKYMITDELRKNAELSEEFDDIKAIIEARFLGERHTAVMFNEQEPNV